MLKVDFVVSSLSCYLILHSVNLFIDCILKIALKGFHDFADDAFTTADKALEVNEEIIDLTEGSGNSGSPHDLSLIEEVHENAKMEDDMGVLTMSADNVEVDKCSKDLAALDINDGAVKEGGQFVPAHVLEVDAINSQTSFFYIKFFIF